MHHSQGTSLVAAPVPHAFTEADLLAGDRLNNELKSSGELHRRNDQRALADQVKREGWTL